VLTALLLLALASPGDTLRLSLADALQTALRGSPAAGEVRAAREQSVIRAAQGVSALLPTPQASLAYGQSTTRLLPDSSVTIKGWTGTVSLAQVVLDPQVFGGVVNAFVYSGYNAADARDRRARIVYDVTTDYLNLVRARALRDVAASAVARAADNLELSRSRERLGSASRIDVMRADVYRAQAEIELLTADRTLAAANSAFLATAGITRDATVAPTEDVTAPADFPVGSPDSLLAEIERLNAGAQMARRASTAAALNLGAAVGRALPSVSAQWTSSYADTLLPRSLTRWRQNDETSCGLRIAFPLLDIKSYVLDIADAAAESRRARAGAIRARLQLRSAGLAAVLGYREARQRHDYAARNLELSRELLRLAQDQYRLGAISLLDLQSVETSHAQAEATLVSALCDTYIQAAQISYLLGRADLGKGE
jgi:outer membrane protein TolC